MTFPNAANGIKKFFIGEILSLIGAVATSVAVILSGLTVNDSGEITDVNATETSLGIAGILIIVAGVVVIIAAILQLVGLFKAAKDEEAFRAALYMIFFSMLVSITSSILVSLFPNSSFMSHIGTVATNLLDIIITFLVIGGIGNLGARLSDMNLQEKAAKLLGIILTVIVLRFIANIVLLLFKESIAEVVVTILGVMILLLSLVQYILYLSLLANAKKTLETK